MADDTSTQTMEALQPDAHAMSLTADPQEKRILAAIDIGTNSIHMVIVQINPALPAFEIIDTEKSTVRLGERDPQTGELTPVAIARSLSALRRCQEIAKARRAEQVIAVATSAVREAANGRNFIDLVREQLGLQIDIISGEEEARRIYLGVLSGMALENRPHIIVDIGGGSTELILGDGHEPRALSSTKVGAVRLKELFIHTDPISTAEFEQMQAYARGMLEWPLAELKDALVIGENPQLVGTSGTIESLVRVVTCEALGSCPTSLHGYVLTLADLEALVVRLRKATYAERVSIPGMSERRAEIILAGAVILRQVMQSLGMTTIKTCERSLREGIVVDWMLKQGLIEDRLRYQASVRERTVLNLAQRFHVNLDSALQVAQFALTMFDQTQGLLHYWDSRQRELLWAAAVLHNAGHYISHASHHKHSYYLIRNGGLLGYTDTEIELIANIARYHRKGPPKKKHDSYRNLIKQDRVIVDQLSAILKLAAALDRRQQGAITQVELLHHAAAKSVVMHLETRDSQDDCGLELWSLNFKKACFEQEFNVTLSTKVHPQINIYNFGVYSNPS